ncbi:MAG TPA: hypothetical protein VGM93_04355 [Acidimicrobiales bacterium]
MTSAPFAPWLLRGEAIVAWARCHGRHSVLPDGVQRAMGPSLLTATRFTSSPVGPFLQLAIAEPARIGLRFGWCLTTVVVDNPQARVGHHLNWGVPATLGSLRWLGRDERRELVWQERDLILRAEAHGPAVPIVFPLRAIQRRPDGPVVVPGHLGGRARLARPALHTVPGDDLAPLAGEHLGVLLEGVSQVVREARHPVGLRATLLAPAQAGSQPIEPAMRDRIPDRVTREPALR